MAFIRNASRTGAVSVTLIGLSLAAGLAIAHDPDLRKLEDKLPPVFGDIYRLGDPLPRSGGFDSSGMTLLSQIPLNNFTGIARGAGNDCWGYTAPSGREYAIMGVQGGYGFVEITNPTNPVIVATIPGPSSDWHDVKVVGNIAYGVSEGGSGIQVMNMANIDSGQVTLVRNWTSGGYSTTHNIVTNEDNGSLWICGANIGNGGLVHIDISNPTLPAFDGGWTGMYVHDAQVVTWDRGALAGRQIAFCLAGFNGGLSETGLRVVDLTNPNSPQVLATLFYPNSQYAHQAWLSEDRRFLYLNDELDEGATVSVTTTRVINVEDPANPFLVKTFTSGLTSIDHNLYTHNGLIFQANYRSGLQVFDALDPENPTRLAYFDTFPGSDSPDYNGAWSNYPFFPSGTIIVSDIERGLFVLRLDAEPAALAVSVPQGGVPEIISPAGGDTITANAVARSASNPIASVDLMVDSGSGFQPVPAVDNGDGTYTAAFPAVPCDSTVRAYLRASTTEGQETVYPANAPAESFAFTVASDIIELFNDDFSSNLGWTAGVAGDTATTGIWTRVNPVGTSAQPGDALFGNMCYVTGQGSPGGGLGDNDVDSGRTTLLSPPFSLAGEDADTTISYWRWYSNSAGASPFSDVFTVDISSNNGQTWTNVETVGPDGPEVSGGWFKHSFRPADFVALTDQTRLRFIASDLGSGSIVEAAIDGVRIERLVCEEPNLGCSPADIAEPYGALNFFDLAAYLASYNAGDPAADLASPFGTLNFFDISAYLSVYNAGCP